MRFVSIALLLAATTAHAENWQQVAKLDSNGGSVLVDVAAITEVKGLRRAWFKSIYTSDQPIPPEYLDSVPKDVRTYRSEVTLRYFNCPERTSAVMRFYWNGADDKAGGYFYQKLLTFRAVLPETLDEKMLEAACTFAGELAAPEAAKLHLPGEAAKSARITRPANPDAYYPSSSVRRKEQGSPVVQVCVGPRGALLREPVVTETSGFADLDLAAIKVARATGYGPGNEDGKPLPESCIKFKIKFAIHGPGMP
jgi:TonB family protein